jgi:hypothetical protein
VQERQTGRQQASGDGDQRERLDSWRDHDLFFSAFSIY